MTTTVNEDENYCPKCGQHFVVHDGDGSCIQDKVIVRIVFGEGPSRIVDDVVRAVDEAVENGDTTQYEQGARELITHMDHEAFCVTEREFETQAEADAYALGMEDMDGWMGHSGILDPDVAETLIKVLEAKELLGA
jgi:hypothetical protein